MEIIKFGGAILKNKKGLNYLNNVLSYYKKQKVLLVISAFSKVTQKLTEAAYLAEKGNDKKAIVILENILAHYKDFSDKLLEKKIKDEFLDKFKDGSYNLKNLIKGVYITKQLTPRTLDLILSYGEYFALHLLYNYLIENGYNAGILDAGSVIVTDDNFRVAAPILDKTKKNIIQNVLPLFNKHQILIMQGFVARSLKGFITTMGLESSNLTAVLIADILNVKKVTFWTDVEGIRTSDPKIIKNSKLVTSIDYSTAYKLSLNGLKLINQNMIVYAEKSNINLIYKSALKPYGGNTIISHKKTRVNQTVILIKEDLVTLNKTYYGSYQKNIFNEFLENYKEEVYNKWIINPGSITIFTSYQSDVNKIKKSMNSNLIFHKAAVVAVINSGRNIELIKSINNIQKITIYYLEYDGFTDVISIYTDKRYCRRLVNFIHSYYFD
jgi:aspartate kinase